MHSIALNNPVASSNNLVIENNLREFSSKDANTDNPIPAAIQDLASSEDAFRLLELPLEVQALILKNVNLTIRRVLTKRGHDLTNIFKAIRLQREAIQTAPLEPEAKAQHLDKLKNFGLVAIENLKIKKLNLGNDFKYETIRDILQVMESLSKDLHRLKRTSKICVEFQGIQSVQTEIDLQNFQVISRQVHENTTIVIKDKMAMQLTEDISHLSKFHTIILSSCRELRQLNFIETLTDLNVLTIHCASKLEDISALAKLTKLQEFDLKGCTQVEDISDLMGLTHFQRLTLGCPHHLNTISILEGLVKLQTLHLSSGTHLKDISVLAQLTQLHTLGLRGCYHLKDISALAKLTNLQELHLNSSYKLEDISAVAELTNLQALDLSCCIQLEDISALAQFIKLQILTLSHCRKLENISALLGLSNLQRLKLDNSPSYATSRAKLKYIPALAELANLQEIIISSCERHLLNTDSLSEELKAKIVVL